MTRILTQEALNLKAGFSGALRTKQECLNALAVRTGLTQQEAWNVYAATSGLTGQDAANVKALTPGQMRTKQDAANIIQGITP